MTTTAREVANYFLYLDSENDSSDISNLKMQKLVYYAYGFHYAIFRQKLFDEPINAWPHGPVCDSLYNAFQTFGSAPIPFDSEDFDASVFTQEQKDFLHNIYDEYGQYSAWKLRDMTHEETPWVLGRNRWRMGGKKGAMLDDEILGYFRKIVGMNETDNILKEHPDILDDIKANAAEPDQGTPLRELMAEFGMN